MAIFFTSDFHLGDEVLVQIKARQFKSGSRMSDVLIANANCRAKRPEDTIIHVGDFVAYGKDKGIESARISSDEYLKRFTAKVVLLEGNHDPNNHVRTDGKLMFVDLGPYRNVSVGHFPSWYKQSTSILPERGMGSIHICGHVHDSFLWKISDAGTLNINVGVDVWNNQIVSITDLLKLISKIRKNTV